MTAMQGELYDQLRTLKRSLSKRIWTPENPAWPVMPYQTVDLIFWRPKSGVNFGDELSRTIVELMLARRGMTVFDEIPAPRRMIAIGSMLHEAENDTVVWGTGRNGTKPERAHFFSRLDVRAVRGPLTRDFLKAKGIETPEIYGDPGLLLPLLSGDRFKATRAKPVVLVPNLNDFEAGVDLSSLPVPMVDPRMSWNRTIADILQYEFVIASSLHALVIAEAYGIPARYLRLSEREALFKYQDYYEGSGRSGFTPARSIGEAIDMGGEPPIRFDPAPLMAAFPYDIWRG